ncbi:MAG: undecaprenyldiphospho-muramoylpentapeptide beta-N-acetylglucosaminyltransferase [Erysipelotrichaceae bacterium]|nr:undecaprenyldiphospho-muramoylpentapeptide beta-N-acetylglucosaminyltransferase [Erysipelotrichaceae bacterium]
MKIAIVAGGTGGHVYPALTLAEELQNRGDEILFIGSSTRMEKDLVPERGFKYIGLDVDIFSGNVLNKLKSLFTINKAKRKCMSILKGYDMAIGFGNYISVPVLLAAKKLGLKTVIHEQNSFAGKANRMLDRKVNLVIGSYPENKKQFRNRHTLILGNPQSSKAMAVEKDSKLIKKFGLDPKKKTVVIFMGSLGSQTINKVVLDYFKLTDGSYQIIYATGKQNYENVLKNVDEKDYIKCFETIDGANVMKNSTLLVCRAGATTLAEITAMGMPAILIPSPYVPNNHQYYNAKSLSDRDAAILIEEKDLTPDKLNKEISDIINNESKLKALGNHALALGNPKVLEDMIQAIEKL